MTKYIMFESFYLEADTLALVYLDRNVDYLCSSKKILIPSNDSDFNSTIRKYLLWVENKFICILSLQIIFHKDLQSITLILQN